MDTGNHPAGRRSVTAREIASLEAEGWSLGRYHYLDESDRMTWRLVIERARDDGSRPPHRVDAYWDRTDEEPLLVLHSTGYTPDFGMLIEAMGRLGIGG